MQDPTDRPTGFPAPAPQGSPSGGTSSTTGVTDQAKSVVGQAADKASTLVDQVKDKATSAVEGQKAGLADQLDGIADAVHKSGQQFSGQQDWIAGAIERCAAELSTLATSLRENDVTALFGQVRTFARQQPAVFIGASFAAGFALARFGKIVAADVSRDDLPTLPEVGHGQG